MSDVPDFGDQTPRGIDLDRLRYARSLTPEERLERNRRAAASVILLREAGRRMRQEGLKVVRSLEPDESFNDLGNSEESHQAVKPLGPDESSSRLEDLTT